MPIELSGPILGILLSLLAAIGFAGQFIGVRLGTDNGTVTDAVLVVLLCNVVIVAPIVAVRNFPSYSELFTPVSIVSFVAAGIMATFIARMLLFKSIDAIGGSFTAPIFASNVLFATIFAVLFLGEGLTAIHFVGILLLVVGIAVISWETAVSTSVDRSFRDTGVLLVVPITAAALIGLEPILISIGLTEGTPVLPGFLLMATAGTISFVSYLLWTRSLNPISVRDTSTIWYLFAGVSTTFGFIAYFAALEVAPVVIVIPLMQLFPLIVIAISALFLPRRLEVVTWRVVISALVIVTGAILVSLSV